MVSQLFSEDRRRTSSGPCSLLCLCCCILCSVESLVHLILYRCVAKQSWPVSR
ncbi:hypothetical protein C0J52_12747 [Blattella germanica]|nr:hypothetical protein C0J52_12747 [Blattella germanica]